jgi:hypothetical protein
MSEIKIGRVYKLVSRHSDECYICSTFNRIHLRFANHKSNYKKRATAQKLTEFLDKHGIENIAMVLIKEYEVIDKQQLHADEQLWINRHQHNCNTYPAFAIHFNGNNSYVKRKKESKSPIKAQSLADIEAARQRRIQLVNLPRTSWNCLEYSKCCIEFLFFHAWCTHLSHSYKVISGEKMDVDDISFNFAGEMRGVALNSTFREFLRQFEEATSKQ